MLTHFFHASPLFYSMRKDVFDNLVAFQVIKIKSINYIMMTVNFA